jgi:hypothetical protein
MSGFDLRQAQVSGLILISVPRSSKWVAKLWRSVLDLRPDHLAGAQAAAIAEAKQRADLEVVGDGEQSPRLVRAHHQRDLLGLADVIDPGRKIQSAAASRETGTAARS